MANQQLVDYIKSQLAAGVTKQDLQKAITAAGWSMQDSNEAFMSAEGKAPPPEAPKTPAPPLQPMPASITPVSRPAAVTNPRPSRQIDLPQRSLTWVWILLGAVALVAVAAAAYMYVPTVQTVVDFYLGRGTPAPVVEQPSTPVAPEATTTGATASSTQSQASSTASTTVNTSVGASTTAQ